MSEKVMGIGQVTYKQYTRDKLVQLILDNFPDKDIGTVAIITTTKFGRYDEPSIMQSITLGKVLKD